MLLATYILVVAILVAIDQYTKFMVVSHIALYEKIEIIKGFFDLTYVRNYGAGFSIMQNETTFFIVITLIAIVLISYLLWHTNKNELLYRISYLLILSGAIGNFIDRLKNVYVIDFLDFYIFGYDFPVFNVADSFLTIGCFVLMGLALMENRNAKS